MTGYNQCASWLRVVLPFIITALFPSCVLTLTLSEAHRLAERDNLQLAALQSAVEAARSAVRQSRLLPNPEVEIALEDFGRNELEVLLSQSVDLGGRRGARVREARARQRAAEAALDAARVQLRAEALRRFGAAVAARERIHIADSLIVLSEASVLSIQRRVDAGATMRLDLIRAENELQEILLERAGLDREYQLACKDLALLWGDTSEPLWEPVGTFVLHPVVPPLRDLRTAADGHPDAAIRQIEMDILEAELGAERAEVFPELAIGAGYLRSGETGESAALVGVSVSLPLFNRNQGAVAQKRHEIEEATHVRGTERLARHAEVERIRAEITTLTERIDGMRQSILPRSEHVLSELTEYYQRGAVGILEVLEAQGALLERWLEQTDNLRDRAALAADLLELTGTELEVLE